MSCRFKEFKSIPETLREKLTQTFAPYAFYVARMNVFLDLPVKEYDLILITDANSGTVQAYIWASYFTFPPSASLERILKGRQAKSKTDAVNQLRVLAELIAQQNKDEVGKSVIQKSTVLVELLRGDGVFRILKAEIDKAGRFGRLSIVGADGRKPRYLVQGAELLTNI